MEMFMAEPKSYRRCNPDLAESVHAAKEVRLGKLLFTRAGPATTDSNPLKMVPMDNGEANSLDT
jgi:hypothetical protein